MAFSTGFRAYCEQKSVSLHRLTLQIETSYDERKETAYSKQQKENWRREIERVVQRCYSNAQVILMGSSVTGFAARGSDSDLCLWMGSAARARNWSSESDTSRLQNIQEKLRSWGRLQTKLISGARVPVLILNNSEYEADISINNTNGLRNTYLLMCYSKMDPRVTKLAVTVKSWAENVRITNAKEHKLSGFAIALLVIHFLQVGCSPPVIPLLHSQNPRLFNGLDMEEVLERILYKNLPYEVKDYRSSNTQPLGELLLGFFEYYNSFNWSKIISIKTTSSVLKGGGEWRNPHIKIEDPSDGGNVARAVWKSGPFYTITSNISAAYKTLKTTHDLKSILPY